MIIRGKIVEVPNETICANCGKPAGKHHHFGGNCPSDEPNVALLQYFKESTND